MPLNYSKWDRLEVSDDSDIEGHPNVDHRSLVALKQRTIHEQRAARNAKIAQLQAEIATNEVLLPRLRTITEEVHGAPDGPAHFSSLVERLKTNPSPDAPKVNAPRKITYDEMILSLLLRVYEEVKEKGLTSPGGGNEERLRETLVASLKTHVSRLGEDTEKKKKELAHEEEEKRKKITSEDLHEGFESHYAPPKPEPKPVKGVKDTKAKTEKKTDIEVINPKGVEQAQVATLASQNAPPGPSTSKPTNDEDEDEDEDEEVPEMTPSLTEFSRLPLRGYEQSFHFIQDHRDVYVPGASDALLVQAFRSEREGKHKYAKQCVHQSLLIQYCEKLGPDGVRLFFKRMTAGDPRAEAVFQKDVEDTYAHIKNRVAATKEEMDAQEGEEQIQLFAQGDGSEISFIVPDGPPPEHLELEGPGTEGLDVEQVRRVLQMRWEIFNGFPENLKEALKSQDLKNVNKVLAGMKVSEAEEVVKLLDSTGILSFAEGGIRDETGRDRGKNEVGGEDGEDGFDSGDEADEEIEVDDTDSAAQRFKEAAKVA